MDIRLHKEKYTPLPAGTYKGIVDELMQVVGRFGDQIQFRIRINTDGIEGLEGEEVTLTAWASAHYSERTKLYRWTRAALAEGFDPNADFSALAMKEKRVLVVVESHVGPDGSEYNKVSDLLAVPRGKKPAPAAAPQPPPPPPPDDDDLPW